MNNSIKHKIVGAYITIFVITTIIVEIIIAILLKYNYYSTVESYMRSQIKYSQDIYLSYLSDYRLEDAILEDRDQFYRTNFLQVQILDNSGKILLDDLGTNLIGQSIETEDVEMAKNGKMDSSIYSPSYDDYQVIAYSAPLYNRTEQVGIIRLIASLEDIDIILMKNALFAALIGFILIIIMYVASNRVAVSIVKPINELTDLAGDLAEGKFNHKAEVRSDDEIGKLAQAINFMIDNVNEKEQLKNEFISSTSHELRTPLTSIKGWAVTLQDGQEDELTRDGLSIIESETDRLQGMVEELLDFSSYTTGKVKLSFETVNIIDLVKNITKQVNPRAKNNDIDLVLNYENDVLLALIDRNRIKQVLLNIIDNSIKFTEADGLIMINIIDEDKFYKIQVIDTGIGISPDEINHITDKFYKGKHSRSHMGLGLSITEEIVGLHGGNMIIESVLNEGTTITIEMPKGDYDEEY